MDILSQIKAGLACFVALAPLTSASGPARTTGGMRLEARIAADQVRDNAIVAAAVLELGEVVNVGGRRCAMWVPCEDALKEPGAAKGTVIRGNKVLVLLGPDDVDTRVRDFYARTDEFRQPAIELALPEEGSVQLGNLTRERIGRIVVIILNGKAVRMAAIRCPLRGNVVIPGAVWGSARARPVKSIVTDESDRANGRVLPLVVVIGAIAIAMAVALRRTPVPRAVRVVAVVAGALAGAVVLGLSTMTRRVIPTLGYLTVVHTVSPVWLAIGGVVGGLLGYAGASGIYAWVLRRREQGAPKEERPAE